mgnify:CR=1 FL=1
MTLDLTQVVHTSGGLRNTDGLSQIKTFASRFLVTQVFGTHASCFPSSPQIDRH